MGFFNKIIKIVYLILSKLNLDGLSRRIMGENNALILLYHSPDARVFEKHIAYIAQYYSFISLETLINAIEQKDWTNIPKNSVVITFDDGHRSNYDLLPVFKAFNIKPTIYLCTQIVGTERIFWWQSIANKADISDNYKKIGNIERLNFLKAKYNFEQTENYPERKAALTAVQLAEMKPYVDFQAHTRFHPIVPMLAEDELLEELTNMNADAVNLGLNTMQDFAFPNGDSSEKAVEMLVENGFRSARTTLPGWTNPNSNLLQLKVFGITDDASMIKLRLQLSGLISYLVAIKLYLSR